MRKLLIFNDSIGRIAAVFAAVLILSIVLVTLSEIAARTFFAYSLSFAWEYNGYAMGAAMFSGLAFTLRTGGHVRVSLLNNVLPARAVHWLDTIVAVVGFGFSLFVTSALGQMALTSFLNGKRSPSVTATPLVLPQGLIALGALLLTLQLAAYAVRRLIGDEPEDIGSSYLAD
ncbi:MAG: TRAP transporter small permease [Silicimonas sp.]